MLLNLPPLKPFLTAAAGFGIFERRAQQGIDVSLGLLKIIFFTALVSASFLLSAGQAKAASWTYGAYTNSIDLDKAAYFPGEQMTVTSSVTFSGAATNTTPGVYSRLYLGTDVSQCYLLGMCGGTVVFAGMPIGWAPLWQTYTMSAPTTPGTYTYGSYFTYAENSSTAWEYRWVGARGPDFTVTVVSPQPGVTVATPPPGGGSASLSHGHRLEAETRHQPLLYLAVGKSSTFVDKWSQESKKAGYTLNI